MYVFVFYICPFFIIIYVKLALNMLFIMNEISFKLQPRCIGYLCVYMRAKPTLSEVFSYVLRREKKLRVLMRYFATFIQTSTDASQRAKIMQTCHGHNN